MRTRDRGLHSCAFPGAGTGGLSWGSQLVKLTFVLMRGSNPAKVIITSLPLKWEKEKTIKKKHNLQIYNIMTFDFDLIIIIYKPIVKAPI